MVLGLILMGLGFFENLLFGFGALIFVLPYFYVYAKSVDESCMIKKIKSSKLTEGDWLVRNLKIGKKLIKAKWDGLSKEEIKLIKKKYKEIEIKQGIPFVPVFFFSFLIFVLIYFLNLDFLNYFL